MVVGRYSDGEVEPARSHRSNDGGETRVDLATFPSGNERLRRIQPTGELLLGQASPQSGLTDKDPRRGGGSRCHKRNIP
jgi:hypothetical protein